MSNRQEYICWMDTEFSGTDPHSDALLEVAGIITDMSGFIVSEDYHALLHVDNLSAVIQNSPDKVQSMHDKSGLWEDLWSKPAKSPHVVDDELQQWLSSYTVQDDVKYLGGNTVTSDRNHIAASFPKFHKSLSYRSMDATTLSIFLRLHMNDGSKAPYYKKPRHRALDDVYDAVAEYQHYVSLHKSLIRDVSR